MIRPSRSWFLACLLFLNWASHVAAQENLIFHAPFDDSPDAVLASGDGKLYTATSLERKELKVGIQRDDVSIVPIQGRHGGCLRFGSKSPKVLCYLGQNMHYRSEDWSGTISFWMRLDPDKDLQPGYCDPLQVTQFAWNNGSFFVDFDKDLPRDFRLGVFSDLKFWNPENIDWEKLPVEKRPMVTVKKPPFSREEWTHVAFTWKDINSKSGKPAVATLYVNGNRWDRSMVP